MKTAVILCFLAVVAVAAASIIPPVYPLPGCCDSDSNEHRSSQEHSGESGSKEHSEESGSSHEHYRESGSKEHSWESGSSQEHSRESGSKEHSWHSGSSQEHSRESGSKEHSGESSQEKYERHGLDIIGKILHVLNQWAHPRQPVKCRPVEYVPSYTAQSYPAYTTSKPYTTPQKPYSISSPVLYTISPSSYTKPPTYATTKPTIYTTPSTYATTKPTTHATPSTYATTKPTTHATPSTYATTKPTTYATPSTYATTKPTTYATPSTYATTKPTTYATPSTHATTVYTIPAIVNRYYKRDVAYDLANLVGNSDLGKILQHDSLDNVLCVLTKVDWKKISVVPKIPALPKIDAISIISGLKDVIVKARNNVIKVLGGAAVGVVEVVQQAVVVAIRAAEPVVELAALIGKILRSYVEVAIQADLAAKIAVVQEGLFLVGHVLSCILSIEDVTIVVRSIKY